MYLHPIWTKWNQMSNFFRQSFSRHSITIPLCPTGRPQHLCRLNTNIFHVKQVSLATLCEIPFLELYFRSWKRFSEESIPKLAVPWHRIDRSHSILLHKIRNLWWRSQSWLGRQILRKDQNFEVVCQSEWMRKLYGRKNVFWWTDSQFYRLVLIQISECRK